MEFCEEDLLSKMGSMGDSVCIKDVLKLLDNTLADSLTPSELEELRERVASLPRECDTNGIVFREIARVVDYIHKTRQDLAAMRSDEIKNEFIPTATDELAAIVGATEQATDRILSAMEQIEELSQLLTDEQAQQIANVVTEVYEACSFQDITGQRISRAVNALQHIELRVSKLLGYLDSESPNQGTMGKSTTPKRADGVERPDEDLLNGPQLPGKGVSQDDVDALFD